MILTYNQGWNSFSRWQIQRVSMQQQKVHVKRACFVGELSRRRSLSGGYWGDVTGSKGEVERQERAGGHAKAGVGATGGRV